MVFWWAFGTLIHQLYPLSVLEHPDACLELFPGNHAPSWWAEQQDPGQKHEQLPPSRVVLKSLCAAAPVTISCNATLIADRKTPLIGKGTERIMRARFSKTAVKLTTSKLEKALLALALDRRLWVLRLLWVPQHRELPRLMSHRCSPCLDSTRGLRHALSQLLRVVKPRPTAWLGVDLPLGGCPPSAASVRTENLFPRIWPPRSSCSVSFELLSTMVTLV